MVIVMRFAVVFMAVLLLAHGLTTADNRPVMHVHDIAALERALTHDPFAVHAAHGGRQCRETGCMVAASQGAWAAMPMILPDLPLAQPFMTTCCFWPEAEQRLVIKFSAPPVPPPKSPVFETTGTFVA